jgi:peptide/nickel transport system permease protein
MAVDHTATASAPIAPGRRIIPRILGGGGFSLAVGGGMVLTLVFLAVFSHVLAPHSPDEINFLVKLQPPSWSHPFGTDNLGQDVFSRVLYGARTSLIIGAVVVGCSLAIGIPFGIAAGYAGGRVDELIMRLADVFLAFPPLLLPLAVAAALGGSLTNAMLAIVVSWFPWYVRLARAQVLTVKENLYIQAARSMGIPPLVIARRHVFPNVIGPILVQASLDFGYAILTAAGLSFLGIGAKPPQIEWGLMVTLARSQFLDYWWVAAFPGFAIFFAVLAFNLLGDGLRDRLDPRGTR